MSVLGEHHVSVSIDRGALPPIRLEVSSLTIRMDEEWIPYVQADVVCPLGDGTVTTIDPQASDVWVSVTARRLFGRIDRLGDVTRRYRGRTLSDITAQFRGKTLQAVTRSMFHDYTVPGRIRREETRTWRLMLREMTVHRKDGKVSMSLASGEARLTDWQHMSSQSDRIAGATMVDKLNYILRLSGFPAGVSYAPANVPTDSQIGDEAIRTPGSSALEFVTGLTRQHGLILWCDEQGRWHLDKDRSSSVVSTLESAGPRRSILDELSTRSRDKDWVTAVMVKYMWQDDTRYDIYSPLAPNPERALILEYNRPYPGSGRAAHVFEQVRGRGRALDLEAVSTYDITPGQLIDYVTPRESVRGRLAAIRWQFPEDAMSVRLREVRAA